MTGPRERTIFLAAAELDGAARASYLDEACGDDATLRARIERLLEIDARSGAAPTTPLEPSAGASDDVATMTLGVGDSIDGFRILEVIGEGGMGVVYLAEQLVPVKRRIALKVIKPGMDSKAVLARFEAERQALALMDHPGIARVLQAGTTDRGLPYFAMEYVKGVPITDAADRNQLDTTQRLELMRKVCDAVQHAHMKGIIHRDLKPSNILVTTDANDELVAKVIDFGVAKATTQQLTDLTVHTQVGHFIGTPAYMSPEQADLTAADIDTRTDVYSLGVILYELLTGQLPFDPAELREVGLEEMRRRIREDDPPKPSTRLTSLDDQTATRISKARRTRLDQLQKNLASELDWIPLKAMRKLRSERYATPNDLSRDLQRYLDGDPLEAGPESTGYWLRKFVKRRRIPIAVGGAFAAILIAATVVSGWLAVEASRSRATAVDEKKAADIARDRAETKTKEAVEAQTRVEELLAAVRLGKALDAARVGESGVASFEIAMIEKMGRGERFDAHLTRSMADQSIGVIRGHETGVGSIAFSPDGSVLASGGNRSLRLWDFRNGQPIGDPLGGHLLRGNPMPIREVTFSPDGTVLASVGFDRQLRLWNVSTRRPMIQPLYGGGVGIESVDFSPDGSSLATGALDGTIRLWDSATWQEKIPRVQAGQGGILSVEFSPDGSVLASGGSDGTIRLWDAITGEVCGELRGHGGRVQDVSFSPDGSILASGSSDETIRLWDVATGEGIGRPIRGHECEIYKVAFSPDGRTLASGGRGKVIHLWDVATVDSIGKPLRGHGDSVFDVVFSPDGKALVSGSGDQTIRIWDPSILNPNQDLLLGHEHWIEAIAFSPCGSLLASGSRDDSVRLWNPATGEPQVEPLLGHEDGVFGIAFSPDVKLLATIDGLGEIRLWDVALGETLGEPFLGDPGWFGQVVFSPDGRILASSTAGGMIHLWDVDARQLLAKLDQDSAESTRGLAFSQDGAILASACQDATIRLWNAATGRLIGEPLRGHEDWIDGIVFSPDGSILASGGRDETIRLWDVSTGRPIGGPLRGHEAWIKSVAFSPDGAVLASGSDDGRIRFWDTATGQSIGGSWPVESFSTLTIAFSPDGSMLACGGYDSMIRLWHAVPLRDRIDAIRARRAELAEFGIEDDTTDPPAEADGS